MFRVFLILSLIVNLLIFSGVLSAYPEETNLFASIVESLEETRATKTLQWKSLRPDPLGHTATPGLYPYAHGDPINYIDLDGRFASAAWEGSKAFGQEFAQPKNLVSLGLDFTPYVGNAKSGYEAVAGEDLITGNNLNYLERGVSVVGVVPWLGNAVKGIAKAGKMAFKGAVKFGKTFKRVRAARRGISRNPLQGTQYTKKVQIQMEPSLKTGLSDNHGFPKIVDNYAGQGTRYKIRGGDGVLRTKIELPGSYNKKDGVFEWILEPDNSVNHRLFVPNRKK